MEANLLEITFQKICKTNADVNPVPSEAISDSVITGTNIHSFGYVKKSSLIGWLMKRPKSCRSTGVKT